MKTPREYTTKYKYYPTIPVEVVNSIIKQAQIEAYNEAIDDCVKNATINVDRCAYGHELTEFYKPFSINKQSILKLKK